MPSFIEKIEIERDRCKDVLENLEKNDRVFVFGGGYQGKICKEWLEKYGYRFDGFLVSDEYYKNDSFLKLSEVERFEGENNIVIISAVRNFDESIFEPYKDKFKCVIDSDSWLEVQFVEKKQVTRQDVINNIDKLQLTYDGLEDEKSRDVMVAYINTKLTHECRYLREQKSDNQYFDDELIKLQENEVLVDCGAYNGDTVQSFIDAMARQRKRLYDNIIAFELDPLNYKKILEKNFVNCEKVNKGVSDKCESVHIIQSETSSRTDINADEPALLTTIDDYIGERKVTFIKMDIEGFEEKALRGAENTIKRNKPVLAICAYHKFSDLWVLPDLIKSFDNSYRLYFRNYEEFALELVLYAIPLER